MRKVRLTYCSRVYGRTAAEALVDAQTKAMLKHSTAAGVISKRVRRDCLLALQTCSLSVHRGTPLSAERYWTVRRTGITDILSDYCAAAGTGKPRYAAIPAASPRPRSEPPDRMPADMAMSRSESFGSGSGETDCQEPDLDKAPRAASSQ